MRSAIVAAIVAVAASKECAEEYAQCGGKNWEGPVCCKSPGSACVAKKRWSWRAHYSECLPISGLGDPVVNLPLGSIRGFDRKVSSKLVSTFWSIPFGEPPIGKRRFHYPEPYAQAWTSVRSAYDKPGKCSQYPRAGGSEDCLHLHVYAPRDRLQALPEDRLSVMFWIYGGAYIDGDAYQFGLYDGSELVSKHDVVLVAGNYRLTVLGFNTYTQGANGETGTQAMADQRLAMQWTQDNVHLFGGDKTAVTIFGESAGAFSVMYHLVSPPSWPLFSKAIMESHTSSVSWFFQQKNLATQTLQGWAEAVGCPAGEGQLVCLQALPASNFTVQPKGYSGSSPLFNLFPSGPVVDGTEFGLLDVPSTLAQQGQFARVPLLLGSNEQGGSIFEPMVLKKAIPGVNPVQAENWEDASTILNWFFLPEDVERINATYPIQEFGKADKPWSAQVSSILRDVVFECSNRRIANAWTAYGVPVYLYTFSFNFGLFLNTLLPLGDFHASELFFVFKKDISLLKLLPLSGNPEKMSDVMSCQWTAFAHNANPNAPTDGSVVPGCEDVHGQVQNWPLYADGRQYYSLKYDWTHHPRAYAVQAANTYPSEFPSDERCDMWDTVTYPWHPFAASVTVV